MSNYAKNRLKIVWSKNIYPGGEFFRTREGGGGGGALPYWRWRGRAAGQVGYDFLQSFILTQGIYIGLIGYRRATPFVTGLVPGLPTGFPSPTMFMAGPRSRHQRRDGACGTTMFKTGPRSRHQRWRARDATDFYECMMIHSRIESPSAPVQGMHMKVCVRYIVTGCILCALSGLRQGQVFEKARLRQGALPFE